jgi:hypothetical protein
MDPSTQITEVRRGAAVRLLVLVAGLAAFAGIAASPAALASSPRVSHEPRLLSAAEEDDRGQATPSRASKPEERSAEAILSGLSTLGDRVSRWPGGRGAGRPRSGSSAGLCVQRFIHPPERSACDLRPGSGWHMVLQI